MRTRATMVALALLANAAWAAGPPSAQLKRCAVDAVVSGSTCIDKYEASVWRVPNATTSNKGLVTRIQAGRATAADLAAGGATQLWIGAADDYAPCPDSGQTCADVHAVSLPGVPPSANLTWFQAQAACKNARKRLPSNAEWQAAVMGTPDPGPDNGTTDCYTNGSFPPLDTGSRSGCVAAATSTTVRSPVRSRSSASARRRSRASRSASDVPADGVIGQPASAGALAAQSATR